MSFRIACIALLALSHALAFAAKPPKIHGIVSGPQHGTYFQVAHDLVDMVGGPADLSLRALPSKGSVENVRRLRDEPGTQLALVQSDVYQAFQDLAAGGDAEAARIVKPLRVVLPLYDEEVHFVVRSDSPLNYVHEIRDSKINVGPVGSGAAMTAATLYRLMFGAPLDAEKVSMLTHEEALISLVKERKLDVAVIVAGQPTPYLTGMEPGVEKHFKLLKVDEKAPVLANVTGIYAPSVLRTSSYPHWLNEDLPVLSVKTVLVTYDFRSAQTRSVLVDFAKSLCRNFAVLQQEGHPKWSKVSLELPALSAGWRYYAPTESILRGCSKEAAKPAASCSLDRKLLGFCTEK
jgi:TRAP transporter TAXI family solute receptor